MAFSPVRFPVPPRRSAPLPVPTSDVMYHTYRSDLSAVRALVLEQARQAGLTEDRATDLVLAVSEVAANTLRHARSSGTLAIWHDADEVVCEIRDAGVITDPLVGTAAGRPAADGVRRARALDRAPGLRPGGNNLRRHGDDAADAHGAAPGQRRGLSRGGAAPEPGPMQRRRRIDAGPRRAGGDVFVVELGCGPAHDVCRDGRVGERTVHAG